MKGMRLLSFGSQQALGSGGCSSSGSLDGGRWRHTSGILISVGKLNMESQLLRERRTLDHEWSTGHTNRSSFEPNATTGIDRSPLDCVQLRPPALCKYLHRVLRCRHL